MQRTHQQNSVSQQEQISNNASSTECSAFPSNVDEDNYYAAPKFTLKKFDFSFVGKWQIIFLRGSQTVFSVNPGGTFLKGKSTKNDDFKDYFIELYINKYSFWEDIINMKNVHNHSNFLKNNFQIEISW